MDSWAILAPGPSAPGLVTQALGCSRLGVVGNAFQLVESADFLVAVDRGWWLKHPDANDYPARKFCSFPGVAESTGLPPEVGSGVAAIEIAASRFGARSIRLYGFDMRGSHFFGPYTNGLRNTTEDRRLAMLDQFAEWARLNPSIEVINCTPGSAICCFPNGDCHAG